MRYFISNMQRSPLCADNTTANSAQEETSFTCNDNDDCLRGVGNSETKFAGRKGKAILNEGETDCGEGGDVSTATGRGGRLHAAQRQATRDAEAGYTRCGEWCDGVGSTDSARRVY